MSLLPDAPLPRPFRRAARTTATPRGRCWDGLSMPLPVVTGKSGLRPAAAAERRLGKEQVAELHPIEQVAPLTHEPSPGEQRQRRAHEDDKSATVGDHMEAAHARSWLLPGLRLTEVGARICLLSSGAMLLLFYLTCRLLQEKAKGLLRVTGQHVTKMKR